jgi:signal transduction histidine kinase
MLAFTVADRGIGIPEDYQAEIFKPFESRTDGSGHRGAGLGLTIVKSLVELHGGHIELKSIPDDGTEITVWLPLVQGEAFGKDDASERAAGRSRSRSAG